MSRASNSAATSFETHRRVQEAITNDPLLYIPGTSDRPAGEPHLPAAAPLQPPPAEIPSSSTAAATPIGIATQSSVSGQPTPPSDTQVQARSTSASSTGMPQDGPPIPELEEAAQQPLQKLPSQRRDSSMRTPTATETRGTKRQFAPLEHRALQGQFRRSEHPPKRRPSAAEHSRAL